MVKNENLGQILEITTKFVYNQNSKTKKLHGKTKEGSQGKRAVTKKQHFICGSHDPGTSDGR
jgi:hypothetical protein